jgi:hypothetical protein
VNAVAMSGSGGRKGPSADVERLLQFLTVLLALGGIALLFHRSNVPSVLRYSKLYLLGLVAYFAVVVGVAVAARVASRPFATPLAGPAIRVLVILLINLTMVMAAAEATLALLPERLWHPDPHHREGAIFARPDPQLHHMRPAGSVATIVSPYDEYRTEVRINSDNLRDVERPIAKPFGTYRILILGDSLTEAVQVSLEQTFAKRLEKQLAQSLGRPVDVINAGLSAGSPTTEYLMLVHKGIKYSPDLVVCAFTLIGPYQDWEYRNDLKLDGEGLVVERTRVPELTTSHMFAALYADSRVMQLIVGKYYRMTRPAVPPLLVSIFEGRNTPEETQAWDLTLRTLDAMRRYSEAHGAKFLVTAIPFSTQVDREFGTGRDREVRLPDVFRVSTHPQQVLERFSREHGVAYLDLLPSFRTVPRERGPLFFPRDSHLTPAGHQVIADALTRYLQDH